MLHSLPKILATTLTPTPRSTGLVLGAAPRIVAAEDGGASGPAAFTLLGYRQTAQPACKGGRILNSHGWRFRHKRMRAIARTFKGQPFISGHDWGDVRARAGTITASWADVPSGAEDELGFFADVELTAQWALEAYAAGNIDRFSIGALPVGEVFCTVHGTPVWTDCWCWPGYVTEDELVAEWEFEDAKGVEISPVNVPAVDGTGVVEASADPTARAEITEPVAAALEQLAELCGRAWSREQIQALATHRGAPRASGGFPRAQPAPTMASQHERPHTMDPAQLRQSLGLPATATDDEVRARIAAHAQASAQVSVLQAQLADVSTARERDTLTAHVEAELTRLTAEREVGEQVLVQLRGLVASAPGVTAAAQRATFDTSLALVEGTAPKKIAAGAAPAARGALQSDARPADAPGADGATIEPDAFETHRTNPHLARTMRACGVSAQNVREHGAATIPVNPKLRELAEATEHRS